MSKYTSAYKGSCIYCGDEVSVCSFLGRQFRVPVSKAFDNPNSCSSEDLASPSKRASPSQRARQSKKAGSSQKRSAFKVSSIYRKKRTNASLKKALHQKKRTADKESDGSPEPLFKAVILREMIRLGRQPNIMVKKSARSVKPIKKCVSESSNEAENLADNVADLM
nr:uncharacterized protein LOC108063681 [Drosophila takahashii]